MRVNDFIEKNEIAIIAKADLNNKRFEIKKRDVELESFDLFEPLVLFGSVESLMANVEGQILPRILGQGNSKCVHCSMIVAWMQKKTTFMQSSWICCSRKFFNDFRYLIWIEKQKNEIFRRIKRSNQKRRF